MGARIICLVIGYCLGLIQTSYILGRIRGIDIREHGSGNAGTTNTLRVMGRGAGALVLLVDMAKAVIAVFLAWLIFHNSHSDMIFVLKIYAGAGVVLGHDFPFYLKFRGGKGIAASAGMIAAFHPYFIPVGLVVFAVIFFTTHYVSVGSLAIYVTFLVQMMIMGGLGVFGMSQGHLTEMYIVAALLTAMAFFMHRGNLVRLAHGEERKTYLHHKTEEKQEQ